MIIIRENTEGFYQSQHGDLSDKIKNLLNSSDDQVIDLRMITRNASERIIKFAFDMSTSHSGAPEDGKSRVTCVDKSNVLNGCRFFRQIFNSVAKKYPDIEADYMYVDAFTQALMQNPERFDIVVTTNLLGDIVTDLSAVLAGGLGMAPSANLGDNHGMFEPVHGSAPDIAGKNIANPIGMILSAQMMLSWLGEKKGDNNLTKSAEGLSKAVRDYLASGKNLPRDLGGHTSTEQVSKIIIEQLK
jgi:3-isopropylmalate dehydrogenase